MNRRASCVGTFEVFEAAHVALRTLLAFSQPVNCIFWPISLRSRRYSRAQGGKLEIPPAQKLSILSSPAAG